MSAAKRERRPVAITAKEARLVLDLLSSGFLVGSLVTPGKLFPGESHEAAERRHTLRELAGKYGAWMSFEDRLRYNETIRLTGSMFRAAQEWQAQNAQAVRV